MIQEKYWRSNGTWEIDSVIPIYRDQNRQIHACASWQSGSVSNTIHVFPRLSDSYDWYQKQTCCIFHQPGLAVHPTIGHVQLAKPPLKCMHE